MLRAAWLLAFISFAGFAGTAAAQIGGGSIAGVVSDPAGSPLYGATITATSLRTHASRTVLSSSAGIFTLPGLAPGPY